MKVEKKELEKSQLELKVEMSIEEFKPFVAKGVKKISKEVKIDGFRSGAVPYDILKQKIGEMSILEESARLAINSNLEKVIKDNVEGDAVGQPKIDIVKLAPNNPLEFKVLLALIPEIKLGEYKDLKIKQEVAKIDDKELEKTMNDLREMQAQEVLVDREIKEGDKVMIDIQMFLDNVPVEGGQGKDTVILMGKDYVVPGFDKQLLGAKKTDVREFKLPYPKEHHMKNLAGNMVEFKVTIKDVYERKLPELNDEFAAKLGLKKIDELKENIKKNISEQKEKETQQKAEREMLDKLIEKTRFGDIPDSLVEHETQVMISELKQTVGEQGGKFEDYLSSLGKTEPQLTLDLMPDAIKRVKVSLFIRELAKAEKIEVTKEEVEKHLKEMKNYYESEAAAQMGAGQKKEIIKRLDSPEYKNYVLNVKNSQKVIEKLREWNILVN